MWKEIINHPNYEVNELGEIKNKIKNKILKPFITTNGYLRIRISNKIAFQVHKIIALYFIDNPNNFSEVNHIDGNKLNNSINNLEWCNRSQNMIHSYKNNLSKNTFNNKGEKHYNSKLKKEDIEKIKEMLNNSISQKEIAKLFNVSKQTISNIKNNKNWKD